MRTYTIQNGHIYTGIRLTETKPKREKDPYDLVLGQGEKVTKLNLWRKNPPLVENGIINSAYPMKSRIGNWTNLASPMHEGKFVLIVIKTLWTAPPWLADEKVVKQPGMWKFTNSMTTIQSEEQKCASFIGEIDGLSWVESVIKMKPEDGLEVTFTNGTKIKICYQQGDASPRIY